mgnify:CR=1 FL=1
MQNGAKPSGMFTTDQVIPDAKYKEIASRLKEAWTNMLGSRNQDLSKPGQGMLLDQGMKYTPIDMLTLQDAEAAAHAADRRQVHRRSRRSRGHR